MHISVISTVRFDNIALYEKENIFLKFIDFENHFKYCLQIFL